MAVCSLFLGRNSFHCYLLHGALFDDTTFKLQEDELTMNMFLHVCKFRCLSELDDVTLSLSVPPLNDRYHPSCTMNAPPD